MFAVGPFHSKISVLAIVAAGLAWPEGVSAAEHLAPGASSCTGCHAASGSAGIPSLADLSAGDIETALAEYRSGARGGTIMPRIAKGFSAGEARAIAVALGRAP